MKRLLRIVCELMGHKIKMDIGFAHITIYCERCNWIWHAINK